MEYNIHYVYKIINLKNNKEYIGVRTSPSPYTDPYMGSSKVLENLYRIEGKENFKKIILKTFNTRIEAEKFESSLLTETYCNSPNTYNITNTGEFSGKKHGFRKDIWYDYYENIRKKYLDGETASSIASYYGCDSGTISSVIKDIKRTTSESQKIRFQSDSSSGARNQSIDIHIPEILDMYVNQLKSIGFISSHFKVHSDVIKRRLKENNIELRTHKESQNLRSENRRYSPVWNFKEEIVCLYKNGTTINKLGKIYGCDYATIKSIINS